LLKILFFSKWILFVSGADPVVQAVALKVTNAIKVKCTQEECLAILREIPDDDPDQTVNPTRVRIL
jgi:hypothetical protein